MDREFLAVRNDFKSLEGHVVAASRDAEALRRVKSSLHRALETLRRVEWHAESSCDSKKPRHDPVCVGAEPAHAPGCELADLLSDASA